MKSDAFAYEANWPLSNPHAQNILASSPLRAWLLKRQFPGLREHQWVDLKLADGTCLVGQYNSPQPERELDSLLVLFHGWEGCSESNYMLAAAGAALEAGHHVFRLNFRDHGPSHHLNQELFHSCRIDEVVAGTASVIERFGRSRNQLAGFSLGGNFALRTALRAPEAGIALDRALAFSPVVSPHACMDALESIAFYEHYFVRKWRRSLQLKQRHFPNRYRLEPVLRTRSIRHLTEQLVREFSGFNGIDDYLHGYSIAGDRLKGLQIPCRILTAEDDPIIPHRDFRSLMDNPALEIRSTRHGGHCAWLGGRGGRNWMQRQLLSWLDQAGTN